MVQRAGAATAAISQGVPEAAVARGLEALSGVRAEWNALIKGSLSPWW